MALVINDLGLKTLYTIYKGERHTVSSTVLTRAMWHNGIRKAQRLLIIRDLISERLITTTQRLELGKRGRRTRVYKLTKPGLAHIEANLSGEVKTPTTSVGARP